MAAGLLLVLLATAAVRIEAARDARLIARDGGVFIAMARAWREDAGAAVARFDQHPGYPALIAAARALWPTPVDGSPDDRRAWERAAQSVSIAAALAATAALFELARRMSGLAAAVATGLMLAAPRKWAGIGGDVMSDATAVAAQMLALLCGWMALRPVAPARPDGAAPVRIAWRAAGWGAATGVASGGAFLVRPEGLLMGAAAGLAWAIQAARRRMPAASFAAASVAACLACAVVAGPYVAAIGGLTRKKQIEDIVPVAVLPPAMAPIAQAGDPEASPVVALLRQASEAMGPGAFILAVVWLIIAGFERAAPRLRLTPRLPMHGPCRDAWLVLGCVALLYAPVLMGLQANLRYLDWRHCLPLALPFAVLGAAGALVGAEALARGAGLPARALRLILPAAFLAGHLPVALQPMREDKLYFREAATRIAALARPDDYLLTDVEWTLHYAGIAGETIPPAAWADDAFLLRVTQGAPAATLLAVSARELDHLNPALRARLVGPVFTEAAQVAQDAAFGEDRIGIYRIDRASLSAGRP